LLESVDAILDRLGRQSGAEGRGELFGDLVIVYGYLCDFDDRKEKLAIGRS